jgi:hypothetical protein
MIPKVETRIYALEAGVEGVMILDGKVPHAVLLELLTTRRRHADDAPAAPLERYWSALPPTYPPWIPLRPTLPRSSSYITIDPSRGCEQISTRFPPSS